MKLHLQGSELQLFTHVEGDAVVFAGHRITSTVSIFPATGIVSWGPTAWNALSGEDFASLANFSVELILFGTGKTLRFLHPRLYSPIIEKNIGIEFMDNRALCRTYNILVAEGRSVGAVLWMDG